MKLERSMGMILLDNDYMDVITFRELEDSYDNCNVGDGIREYNTYVEGDESGESEDEVYYFIQKNERNIMPQRKEANEQLINNSNVREVHQNYPEPTRELLKKTCFSRPRHVMPNKMRFQDQISSNTKYQYMKPNAFSSNSQKDTSEKDNFFK